MEYNFRGPENLLFFRRHQRILSLAERLITEKKSTSKLNIFSDPLMFSMRLRFGQHGRLFPTPDIGAVTQVATAHSMTSPPNLFWKLAIISIKFSWRTISYQLTDKTCSRYWVLFLQYFKKQFII